MQSPVVRSRVFSCIISFTILAITLIVCTYYCAHPHHLDQTEANRILFPVLSISSIDTIASQSFNIVLILFILIFTVYFAHSAIRLGIELVKRRRRNSMEGARPGQAGRSGFAHPSKPIRVVLARDEELGLGVGEDIEEDKKPMTPVPPPPAYGLWRGSVVSPS